jgi:hypothetical protein
MFKYGIRAPVFNTKPLWAEQVEIEVKFHRVLKLQCIPGCQEGIEKTLGLCSKF